MTSLSKSIWLKAVNTLTPLMWEIVRRIVYIFITFFKILHLQMSCANSHVILCALKQCIRAHHSSVFIVVHLNIWWIGWSLAKHFKLVLLIAGTNVHQSLNVLTHDIHVRDTQLKYDNCSTSYRPFCICVMLISTTMDNLLLANPLLGVCVCICA